MNFIWRLGLVILSSKFMMGLLAIHRAKLSVWVDELFAFFKLMIDAVGLIIVILEGDDLVLVKEHGVLNLS